MSTTRCIGGPKAASTSSTRAASTAGHSFPPAGSRATPSAASITAGNTTAAGNAWSSPPMDAEESCWGITVFARWPEQVRVSQFGMPNVFHHKAQPTDFAIAPYREFLAWWVPVDDESHIQFTVAAVRMSPELARKYVERREERLGKRTQSRAELAERVLKGELSLDEIDPDSTDFLRLQDDIAQIGQGRIPDHAVERL